MDYITTDPPTTDPPTTNPPTTHPTTIDPPTTEPITTEPTTAVPSTESATTAVPSTESATTAVPSTESPTTEHSTDTPTAAELQTTENPTAANKPNLPKPCSGAYCLCTCPCVKKKRTFSDSLMYAQIQQKYIHVQKDQLSKTKRIKHSSANISQSEANLGLSSVLVIIILFSGFIFLDISRVFVWCYNRRRKTTTGKISPKKYKDKKLIFTSQ
ncbi:hypothetical protein SNE40_017027 [Patella caerulea]|uniref:Uncharacterized protein n=1 Tax=Patella caerulea TaxID=87958 RepID=A0AAN8PEZ7_PATCE